MKPRIKIDSSLMILAVVLTGFLFFFRKLYPQNIVMDNVLDFIGYMAIFKGTLLRMSARGHKKANSQKSHSLVTTGPYTLTRNPMYLGTFMVGCGFILMFWPWWLLPVYAILFYLRFNQEMTKEEALLTENFGQEYKDYCAKTPRIFPSIIKSLSARTQDIFNLQEAFSTKEKRALFLLPVLAIGLETLQEWVVFGVFNIAVSVMLCLGAAVLFAISLWILYQRKS
ncbi:MAG: isoprenylcysteine carboxylmethyltransferase family protein [Candidatus Omnitrophica bacterium]|nr:isoprenylcysteine carboxylmethyltransferase family protein [Candidatus Omnitrophota bacterium]